VYFDNQSGEFTEIGDFSRPVEILPNRTLKLGQTTSRFWVINAEAREADTLSAYSVDLSGKSPQITHMGAVPISAEHFSIAPNGDLLMTFRNKSQAPIRMTQAGDISFACSALPSGPAVPAPN